MNKTISGMQMKYFIAQVSHSVFKYITWYGKETSVKKEKIKSLKL